MVDDLGLYQAEDAEEVLSPEVSAIHPVRERIRYRLILRSGSGFLRDGAVGSATDPMRKRAGRGMHPVPNA